MSKVPVETSRLSLFPRGSQELRSITFTSKNTSIKTKDYYKYESRVRQILLQNLHDKRTLYPLWIVRAGDSYKEY